MLAAFMAVFGIVFGYSVHVSTPAIGILVASVLSLIGLACYLKFKPSALPKNQRASFIFLGAISLGFGIWVAVVLALNAAGFSQQIKNDIGLYFFAITSLIICFAAGGLIGDLIGKNKDEIQLSLHKAKNNLFRLND